MKNICLILEYNGKNFCGYQIQPDQRTVQGDLEKALNHLTGEKVVTIASGRTDSGVSAEKQYVNFFSNTKIPPEKIKFALNRLLVDEISIRDSFEVSKDFHARFSALSRTYRYRILNQKSRSALRFDQVYQYPIDLDFHKMKEVWENLNGKKDFTKFMKLGSERKNPFCTILETKAEIYKDEFNFYITADSFLRGMVRLLIGSLIFVGNKKILVNSYDEIIQSNIKNYTFSAGYQGLCLIDINYPKNVFL